MPTTLSTVLLSTKGECRKISIPLTDNGNLTMEIIQKYIKKKEQPVWLPRECVVHLEKIKTHDNTRNQQTSSPVNNWN